MKTNANLIPKRNTDPLENAKNFSKRTIVAITMLLIATTILFGFVILIVYGDNHVQKFLQHNTKGPRDRAWWGV